MIRHISHFDDLSSVALPLADVANVSTEPQIQEQIFSFTC